MVVRRIVPNIAATDLEALRRFYVDVIGLDLVMDHGWIVTLAGDGHSRPQLSLATQGGAGTPVPDLSIEVDDLDEVLGRVQAGGWRIDYGPAVEAWGVRRFFVRDPAGRLINILSHDTA